MNDRSSRYLVATIAVLAGALTLAVSINSTRWIGTTFPGFFVMANRVVASITLPGWLDADTSTLLQHEVVAVDGEVVTTADAAYAATRRAPVGTPIAYSVRAPDGTLSIVTTASRRFSATDFVLIFLAYLMNGAVFLVVGLIAYALKPRYPPSRALLVVGVTTGFWVITGADLYGPHWFSRLHVLAEAVFGAGLLHFALVFPTDRLGSRMRRSVVLTSIYGATAVLALWYESVFYTPAAYTTAHVVATGTHAVGVAAVMLSVTWGFVRTESALARRRTSVVVLGSLGGFLVPVGVLWASAVLGGSVPVNAAAFTAFFFPLSLGYAVIKRDLFEIDVLLRRTLTYGALVLAVTVGYLTVVTFVGFLIPGGDVLATSPLGLALLNVALLLAFMPMRLKIQATVDRLFFRQTYRAPVELSNLSRSLAAARTFDDVTTQTRLVLDRTVSPARVGFYVIDTTMGFRRVGRDDMRATFDPPLALLSRIESGEILARYEWDEVPAAERPALWDALEAELLIPAHSETELIGVVVLSAKKSGRPYSIGDVEFLEQLAGQVTLAMKNAEAWEELSEQAASARRLAEERGELAMLRSRFVMNASHEFRTPLTHILSATDLLDRYGDRLNPERRQHRLGRIRRAVAHMTGLLDDVLTLGQAHAGRLECHPSRVRIRELCEEVLADVRANATEVHRIALEGNAVGREAVLDAKLIRYVLDNLLGNAVKYSPEGGTILLHASHKAGTLVFRVTDEGVGISPEDQAQIFEPFQRGENVDAITGSGLGLAIAREAVVTHGGKLTVESELGVGTSFIVSLATGKLDQAEA